MNTKPIIFEARFIEWNLKGKAGILFYLLLKYCRRVCWYSWAVRAINYCMDIIKVYWAFVSYSNCGHNRMYLIFHNWKSRRNMKIKAFEYNWTFLKENITQIFVWTLELFRKVFLWKIFTNKLIFTHWKFKLSRNIGL